MPVMTRRALALAPALLLSATISAHAAPVATGTLRVVHGVPGRDVAPTLDPQLPVDVLVNNKICLLQGLTFRTVTGPFVLPVGSYDVKVSLANTVAPCSNTAVIDAPLTVTAGSNSLFVASVARNGAPIGYAFSLDLTAVPAGQDRAMIVHAANAGAVDVVLQNGKSVSVVRAIQTATERSATVPAATYEAKVVGTERKNLLAGPTSLALAPSAVNLVIAVGSSKKNSFQLITDTIPSVN